MEQSEATKSMISMNEDELGQIKKEKKNIRKSGVR